MSYIYIAPIELEDHSYLEKLESFILSTFRLGTKRREFKINLKDAFDPNRVQYNSSLILRQLIKKPPPGRGKNTRGYGCRSFYPYSYFCFR